MADLTSRSKTTGCELEASLRQLTTETDARLRKQLVDRATGPSVTLRAGGPVPHRNLDWYKARESVELAAEGFPIAVWELDFPAPASSPSWHAAEFDAKRSMVFRFFVRNAWLSMTPPSDAIGLRFRVLFGIHAQAVAETVINVEGATIEFAAERNGDGCRLFDIHFALTSPTPLTIRLACAHAGIPACLYAGSTDDRLLSAAIAKPEWLFAYAGKNERASS